MQRPYRVGEMREKVKNIHSIIFTTLTWNFLYLAVQSRKFLAEECYANKFFIVGILDMNDLKFEDKILTFDRIIE